MALAFLEGPLPRSKMSREERDAHRALKRLGFAPFEFYYRVADCGVLVTQGNVEEPMWSVQDDRDLGKLEEVASKDLGAHLVRRIREIMDAKDPVPADS